MDDQAPATAPSVVPPAKLWPIFLAFLGWFLQSTFVKIVLLFAFAIVLMVATIKFMLWMVIPDLHAPDIIKILPKIRKTSEAIVPITFGTSGCSATIIASTTPNSATLELLTAAHCVKLGQQGQMRLPDGTVLPVKCVSRDPISDAAWLVAQHPGYDVTSLTLADEFPQAGEVVWHQGFGRDKPGNRESGKYMGPTENGNKLLFRLSASPGDSGGGIILDSLGRVLSACSSTTNLGGMGDVKGCSPLAAAKIRPRHTLTSEEPPEIFPVEDLGSVPTPPVLRPPKGDS